MNLFTEHLYPSPKGNGETRWKIGLKNQLLKLVLAVVFLPFLASAQNDCSSIPNSISGYIYLGEFNNSKYYCSDGSNFDWWEATSSAASNGGHLVVINSQAENDFVQNAIIANYAWIGYTDENSEGNFEWVNGDAQGYTHWASGEPNNGSPNGGYADYTVIKRNNGKWYDRNGNDGYEFVMEIPCPAAFPPPGATCFDQMVHWDLENCSSNSGGSNADYSEFTPSISTPTGCGGNVDASIVYRDNGNHSCAPGMDGNVAMCVGTGAGCSFINNDQYALRFDVTVNPPAGGTASLSGLSFYEKAPAYYNWIGGSSGPNDYPTKYGIRVTVGGSQVYKDVDISTTGAWSLETFDFSNDPDFTVNATTTFSFELRAYCRVGNGASQTVWDIDEIKAFGCCEGPCATSGGDSDGDGVCDNDDCAPNDASLPATPGTACNDGDPNTVNDMIQSDGCTCAGTFDPCATSGGDSDGDGVCDNDDCAPNDASLPATPGTACNDGDPNTVNDMIQADGCTCAGSTPVCDNITLGGTIGFGANCSGSTTVCNAAVPMIENCASPSGGSGAMEIIWLRAINNPTCAPPSTTIGNIGNDPLWSIIPGETGLTLNPGTITQKTCYLRCTRRTGCDIYLESNIIMADLDPNCGGGGAPNCDTDISITTGNGSITVTGLDGAPVSSLQIFTSDWTQQLANCFADCGATKTVNLPAGDYIVFAKYYTAGYQLICQRQENVTVGGGGGPCANAGGDSDGDGVCDNDDCAPNDANLPATPGTACNDGNPNTNNDMIQADGCTCAGTPINDPCANAGGDSDGDGVCDNDDCAPNDANLPATPGTACNDGNPNTNNDMIQADGCTCAGTPGGGGTPNCDTDITITTGNGSITVTGLDGAPVSSLQIFTTDWTQQLANCFADCGATKTVNVPAGDYIVFAKYYTAGYQLICQRQENVTVGGGGDPCASAGGDSDGDGVCDNDDNCPNTANPGQEDADGDGIGDVCDTNVCDNVTDGGQIAGDETGCGSFDPAPITNAVLPSGGSGTIEYLWLSSTSGCPTSLTQTIAGANGMTYDPGVITQTTYYVRCSRRANCTSWTVGESNCVVKTIGNDSDGDGVCDSDDCAPNDASLPAAPGTACDDGNPNTGNDVIQSDGCTCAGTPGGGGSPNCDTDITITTGAGTITVTGLDGAPVSSLQIFTTDWTQQLANCFADCGASKTVNVPAGDYIVFAKYYTAGYQLICQRQENVTVGGVDPCASAGGDSDGDGVCDNDDCQPNDPAYPATPGTACNDGDPNTTNDVVQADGCSCAGTQATCAVRTVSEITQCDGSTQSVFWTSGFISGMSNINNSYHLVSPGEFIEYDDGTAEYNALVVNNTNANAKFELNLTFSGRTATAPAGSPKDAYCYSANTSDYYYYPTTGGTIYGRGALEGAVVDVARLGESFQVGTGANLHENVFGASGWVDVSVTSQPNNGNITLNSGAQTDLNFNLSGGAAACFGNTGPVLPAPAHPKFVNELPNIPRINATNGGTYNIGMEESSQWLGLMDANGNPVNTTVWGYTFNNNQMYLGPTFMVKKDIPVDVKWMNNLPMTHLLPVDESIHKARPNAGVPTVVHLHGGHTESASDGYPEAWFTQNFAETGAEFKKQTYHYDNDQEAAPLWYHDHTLGMTRLNVYAGLAGMYLIRDDNELSKDLPTGEYERELIIQDKQVSEDGSLYFPALLSDPEALDFPTNPNIEPTIFPEFFGDYILVNGMAWPKMEVEPTRYRLRLLNASDSRFYIFKLSNGATFQQIGTDGGLLNSPVSLNQLVLAPAERADIIIDFSSMSGQSITLQNIGPDEPFKGMAANQPPADPATSGVIMQFNVGTYANESFNIPNNLRQPIQYLGAESNTRQLLLLEGTDQYGRLQPSLGTVAEGIKQWQSPITENPVVNETEIWEVYNATEDAHPIHIHQVFFQLVNRQEYTGSLDPNTSQLKNIQLVGAPIPPAANEQGWKDTYIVPPGQVARFKIRFDLPGKFVWHCHILSHEDWDMMRPLEVMPQGGGGGAYGDCASINISTSAGAINVTGLDNADVSSLQVFSSDWTQQYFSCFADCGASQSVSVPSGSYIVFAKYYSAGYQLLCQVNETVNVTSAFLANSQFQFEVAKEEEHAEIIWAHDKGEEVESYVVERSLDGRAFEAIADQLSRGGTQAELYQAYDLAPAKGDNYYRIKMKLRDGTVDYSEVKKIHYADLIDFVLFPNPANEFVKVNLEEIVGTEGVTITIYNNLGLAVKVFELDEVYSKYYQMDIRSLHEGHYIVWLNVPGRKPLAKQLMVGKI